MAGAATPELAAAVSDVGGLGALGSAMLPADELRGQAAAVRDITDRPFQANFFCHARPQLDAAEAARARDHFRPVYDELGLGEPPEPAVPARSRSTTSGSRRCSRSGRPSSPSTSACRRPTRWRAICAAGIRVLATATTVAEAQRLERDGVDAVVAQGAEAGGHRGSFLVDGDDGPVGHARAGAAGGRRRRRAGRGRGRHRRRPPAGRRAGARRGRRPDRHGLPVVPGERAPRALPRARWRRPRRRAPRSRGRCRAGRRGRCATGSPRSSTACCRIPRRCRSRCRCGRGLRQGPDRVPADVRRSERCARRGRCPPASWSASLARDADELLARLAGGDPA